MNDPRASVSSAAFAAFLFLLVLTGCGDSVAERQTVAVRDSAGIRIVESAEPAWGEDEGWRLTDVPLVEIGMAEGPVAYLLDGVRGTLRLDDGRIVVANAGSSELRFYGPDGAHLQSVGRQGDGPAEYRGISWLSGYRGDSLMVFDFQSRRVSVLAADGSYGRGVTFASTGEGGVPSPQAPFADGTLLGRRAVAFTAGEVTTGMRKSDAVFERYSEVDGSVIDSLITLPDQERYVLAEENLMMVVSPLLTPRLYQAAAGDSVFIGRSSTVNIGVYGSDGTLRRLVRRSGDPVRVTPDEVTALVAAEVGRIEEDEIRNRMQRIHEQLPRPEVRPAFSSLATDDAGNLWVRGTVLPGEPNLWTVYDADGRLLGPVHLPDDFRPMHIGEDFILGVMTDELGVEVVRMYGVEKGL